MRVVILIILSSFCLKGCLTKMSTRGVLILDNQSDYRIDITFYRYIRNRSGIILGARNITGRLNNNFSDTSIRIEPNAEWVKSYGVRGGGGIRAALDYTDSAKIIYGDERIAFSPNPKGIAFNPNPTGRDLLYDDLSYIKTQTKKGLFRKKVDQTNFRYIFTNADYEAAKPIDP